MRRIRLLIADDHPVVRAGLHGMFASQPDFEIVGEACNGAEAILLTAHRQPDIVMMDLRMVVMDGATATEQIRKQYPTIPVLILTTYDSNTDILRAREAGATGYLLKDTPCEQLCAAIRSVTLGKSVLAPEIATRLLQQMHHTLTRVALSERELEVLTLVARGASNKEATRNLHISEATIKSHLFRIFSTLDVTDRTAAVTVALEQGLLHLKL
ncbi:MAG: response regulator transcription factor [Ktedonobacteraceae bacterium]